MITIQEFANQIKEEITDYLPPKYQSAEVVVTAVPKNNGVECMGLSLVGEGSEMSPMLYLESYYEGFQRGAYMNEVLEAVANEYVECMEMCTEEVVTNGLDMSNFASVKDRIGYQLINKNANKNLLKTVPHREVEDLAVVYRVLISTEEFGSKTALVTNTMQSVWGVTGHQLQEVAENNVPRLQTPVFMPMQNIMMELMGVGEPKENLLDQDSIHKSDDMFVLTNKDRMYGAAVMLDTGILEKVRQILDTDFYILPSSIHEAVIIPKDICSAAEPLKEMVGEINADHVAFEEILSNEVYEFNEGDEVFKQVEMPQKNREDHER